ncbi:MAG: hypothetical protein ACE37F_10655 [Nannocystaceae bacterium]|nr:hypothetical protein [bacterium]
MKRLVTLLVLGSLAVTPMGCKKNDKGTDNPDEAAQEDGDPMAELQAMPEKIQAELDLVLQPITDVEVVVDQLTSIPTRYGMNASDLTAMASAKFDGGTVEFNADVSGEAKAEIEAMLTTIEGIAVGLKETPARAKTAAANLAEMGVKSTAMVTKLTTSINAKLANPLLKADKKVELQAELDLVMKVDADIKASIGDAKNTVMGVPKMGTEALAKLTAALAGGASAG